MMNIYIYTEKVVLTILKNIKVNGKDYPIYYGKMKKIQTTNQVNEAKAISMAMFPSGKSQRERMDPALCLVVAKSKNAGCL